MEHLMLRVSVVMSVYNGERYLRESVESILSQTINNYEFIIVDDGSTDTTWRILTCYAKLDNRIRLIKHQHNRGLTKSLNEAIQMASREYVARMDADDVSHPNRLEEQIKILNEIQHVALVVTWTEIIDENSNSLLIRKLPPPNYVKNFLRYENLICHGSAMFRKTVFYKLGAYNPDLKYNQDYALWRKFFDSGHELYIIPQPLYKYRISATNISIAKKHSYPEQDRALDFLNSNKKTWLASLYLQQMQLKKARKILGPLLFTNPRFWTKIIYYLISFFPNKLVSFFMFSVRTRIKLIANNLRTSMRL